MSTSAPSTNVTVVPLRTVVASSSASSISPTPVSTVSSISAFTSATSSLMAAQFNVMMNTLQQMMSSFRAELRRDQEETVEKAAKRARLAKEITFRRKGNEKQYRFNELVQDKLSVTALRIEEASTNAVALTPAVTPSSTPSPTSSAALGSSMSGPLMSALQQAKAAVEEGTALLKDRQKAIRLVDRSELGWAVVNEYGEDELAEDSDDEKKIAKAVATVERKAAQLKKTCHSGRGGYNQSRPTDAPSRAPAKNPDIRVLGYPVL